MDILHSIGADTPLVTCMNSVAKASISSRIGFEKRGLGLKGKPLSMEFPLTMHRFSYGTKTECILCDFGNPFHIR